MTTSPWAHTRELSAPLASRAAATGSRTAVLACSGSGISGSSGSSGISGISSSNGVAPGRYRSLWEPLDSGAAAAHVHAGAAEAGRLEARDAADPCAASVSKHNAPARALDVAALVSTLRHDLNESSRSLQDAFQASHASQAELLHALDAANAARRRAEAERDEARASLQQQASSLSLQQQPAQPRSGPGSGRPSTPTLDLWRSKPAARPGRWSNADPATTTTSPPQLAWRMPKPASWEQLVAQLQVVHDRSGTAGHVARTATTRQHAPVARGPMARRSMTRGSMARGPMARDHADSGLSAAMLEALGLLPAATPPSPCTSSPATAATAAAQFDTPATEPATDEQCAAILDTGASRLSSIQAEMARLAQGYVATALHRVNRQANQLTAIVGTREEAGDQAAAAMPREEVRALSPAPLLMYGRRVEVPSPSSAALMTEAHEEEEQQDNGGGGDD